jgi:hypothetical protein
MSDPFAFWVFLLLLSAATAVVWLLTGRVARREDDLAADERVTEAAWIAETIERWGGDVPQPVVEQVLELHRRYLDGPPPELPPEIPPKFPPEFPTLPSTRDHAPVQGDDPRRESPVPDVRQTG